MRSSWNNNLSCHISMKRYWDLGKVLNFYIPYLISAYVDLMIFSKFEPLMTMKYRLISYIKSHLVISHVWCVIFLDSPFKDGAWYTGKVIFCVIISNINLIIRLLTCKLSMYCGYKSRVSWYEIDYVKLRL